LTIYRALSIVAQQGILAQEQRISIVKIDIIAGGIFGTHRSLNKDAPVSHPVQRVGIISSHAILGGLHLSFPKIISGRIDDAVRPRWEWL
jgi:hypothetical protein